MAPARSKFLLFLTLILAESVCRILFCFAPRDALRAAAVTAVGVAGVFRPDERNKVAQDGGEQGQQRQKQRQVQEEETQMHHLVEQIHIGVLHVVCFLCLFLLKQL